MSSGVVRLFVIALTTLTGLLSGQVKTQSVIRGTVTYRTTYRTAPGCSHRRPLGGHISTRRPSQSGERIHYFPGRTGDADPV